MYIIYNIYIYTFLGFLATQPPNPNSAPFGTAPRYRRGKKKQNAVLIHVGPTWRSRKCLAELTSICTLYMTLL